MRRKTDRSLQGKLRQTLHTANDKHLKILEEGVEAWNEWRIKYPEIVPDISGAIVDCDLSGINLSRAKLTGVDFSEANLSCANLSNSNLGYANMSTNLSCANLNGTHLFNARFRVADLGRANLSNTRLFGADLMDANLHLANLRHADLSFANLNGASLQDTDFTDAKMFATAMANIRLSEAKGLEEVRHAGPSFIGIDTLYMSKGQIPETFLRACGVPENFIRYIPSLVNSEAGIQFYSCFISYSSKDEAFARRLHGRMRDAQLRVWFAPEELKGGNLLIEQIETAIHVYDKLLIVLSEFSLKSEWVMTELRNARKAERQSGKRKLFPIRLVDFETLRAWERFDADSGKDLAVELREYFIPDFSNWKDHDSFEAAFGRLLEDLRAESRTP